MIKASDQKKKNQKIVLSLSIAILCVLFFAGGLAIPLVFMKNAENEEMSKLRQVLSVLENRYYYGSNDDEFTQERMENAIAALASLPDDPHTQYFSIEQAKSFTSALSGSSSGIGITYTPSPEGTMIVSNVFFNSPAEQGGLEIGDEIISVAGQSTAEKGAEEIVKLIGSSQNQPLDFEIVRNGETVSLQITPSTFSSSVALQILDKTAVIEVSSFSENSGKEFSEAVKKAKEGGANTLILDLRNNTGGYLKAATEIAASLLPEKSVVMLEETKDGSRTEVLVSPDYSKTDFDEIIILQNENTASASEVLIGALKDNLSEGTVTTIGTTTYGKGTEQVSVPFSDGTSLKYTIAQWYTPDGISINKTGFAPDQEVLPAIQDQVTYRPFKEGDLILADTVSENAGAVQVYLSYLGYPADRSDNYFSPASSQALAQFQTDEGLEATGAADETTFKRLVQRAMIKNLKDAAADVQMNRAVEIALSNQ